MNAALQLFPVEAPAMSTVWAMPSRWTFSIPPIRAFIDRHTPPLLGIKIADPFCGNSGLAFYSNDLSRGEADPLEWRTRGSQDAGEWCERLLADGVQVDMVLFDPPYSPRQISECYKSIGLKVTGKDTQNAALYARVRKPLAAMLKPGGVALSFGWQSSGFSKKEFRTTEILLVQHGGAHNDTICVAQVKL